jgi:hypothetical protein
MKFHPPGRANDGDGDADDNRIDDAVPAPVSFDIDRYVAETAFETPLETVAELQAALDWLMHHTDCFYMRAESESINRTLARSRYRVDPQ